MKSFNQTFGQICWKETTREAGLHMLLTKTFSKTEYNREQIMFHMIKHVHGKYYLKYF